jgi:hypothetical protein
MPYHVFEAAHRKSVLNNNEGRELKIALPNEWDSLPVDELMSRAQTLAVTAAGKDTDMQWAVHWNKTHTNLHLHVMFSERCRVLDAGSYDRDIFLTGDGKVARRKADRAKYDDGTEKPPVHRKGDAKGGFSAKDKRFKSKLWAFEVKASLEKQLRNYGVVIEERNPLHEFHEGKGSDAPLIAVKNAVIRENNKRIVAAGLLPDSPIVKMLISYFKDRQTPVLHTDKATGELTVTAFESSMDAAEFMGIRSMPSDTLKTALEAVAASEDIDIDEMDDDEIDALIAAGEAEAVEDMQSLIMQPEPLTAPALPEAPHKPVDVSMGRHDNYDEFLALIKDSPLLVGWKGSGREFDPGKPSHSAPSHIMNILDAIVKAIQEALKLISVARKGRKKLGVQPTFFKGDWSSKKEAFDDDIQKGREKLEYLGLTEASAPAALKKAENLLKKYKVAEAVRAETKAHGRGIDTLIEPELQQPQTHGLSIAEMLKKAIPEADKLNAERRAQRKSRDKGLDR